ncbi:MAG: metal ABC transporter substrate-binding protein [Planctomycetota bacterium]|nr:metal ABC transporter substrate-binding protein [Planctomycetota bacterium]
MIALASCGRDANPSPATSPSAAPDHQPVIVVSIHPVATIVQQLVDNWATVHTLMPPGANPHEFEPTAQQMETLSRADVLITVGMNLDAWAEKAARQLDRPKLQIIRMADLLGPAATQPATLHTPLARVPETVTVAGPAPASQSDGEEADDDHDHDHGHDAADDADHAGHHHNHAGPNAHLWMDPLLTDAFVFELGKRLEPHFPPHLTTSLHNRVRLTRTRLLELHQEVRMHLARLTSRRIVTFHNAFDLFAQRYNIQVVKHLTEIELSPGGEVTASSLVEAIGAVKRYELKAVYAEPAFPDAAVKAISEQTGARVLKLDDLGNPSIPGYRDYFEIIRSNVETLREGQGLSPAGAPDLGKAR